jgi:hypothetical protein
MLGRAQQNLLDVDRPSHGRPFTLTDREWLLQVPVVSRANGEVVQSVLGCLTHVTNSDSEACKVKSELSHVNSRGCQALVGPTADRRYADKLSLIVLLRPHCTYLDKTCFNN